MNSQNAVKPLQGGKLRAKGLSISKGHPYWRAPRTAIAAGYAFKRAKLHGSDEEIVRRCEELHSEAMAWLSDVQNGDREARARLLSKPLSSLNPLRGGDYFDQIQRAARVRAEKRGYEYSLPDGWARQAFLDQKGLCALTGIPMHMDRRSRSPFMPTIDKIDPAQGYTIGNCRIVSFIANAAKGAFTDEEFFLMCAKATAWHRSCRPKTPRQSKPRKDQP